MSSHLFAETMAHIPLLAAVLAIAAVAKALASVSRTWIEQTSRTSRLAKSLEGTKPHQRAGIILACGQLEGRSAGGPDTGEADDLVLADRHHQLPMLIMETNRDYERHGN